LSDSPYSNPRERNPAWKGNAASISAGYNRAHRWFPIPPGQVCAECEVAPATERAHWDSNPLNNTPPNVIFLCSGCHRRLDGNNDRLIAYSRAKAAARTHCPQGHAYDEANTYITPRGGRVCKECRKLHKRTYKAKLHPPKDDQP
jgi:uncharacterized protein YlaI